MTYLETVPAAHATGTVRAMYERAQETTGYIPNHTKAFSLRPDVHAAWVNLLGSIRGHMEPRRYELVTLAAALALRSSYCAIAHGKVLNESLLSAGQLTAVLRQPLEAGLSPVEVALMDFAQRVVRDASSVRDADVQHLRDLGLSDKEIFDVAAAVAARCFFSKLLDAVGAQPDAVYAEQFDRELLDLLTVGRPVGSAEADLGIDERAIRGS